MGVFVILCTKRLILGANDRTSFERKLDGHICSDPKISLFVRLRTLVANGTFCLLFAAVGKK